MAITENGLGEYLKEVVEPNILKQISPEAFAKGLSDMAVALNNPNQLDNGRPARGR